jgi:hypothetical protein
MLPMNQWRYFGRSGASGEPFEVYRIPSNGKAFNEQSPREVERLRRDGTWANDPADVDGIWREVFLGGFSESDDELTEEAVNTLFLKWSTGRWPGR